ncbi:MAG: PIN domain-containing protein, partial [Caldisericaceae bacterium]|nr:PIN domain-containing protein [Caldisericaceae bacterium]
EKRLLKLFSEMQTGDIKVFCLDIVFLQIIFVLKSYYGVNKEEIIEKMLDLLSFEGLIVKDKYVLERMLEMWRKHSGDIVDCYIAASMEKAGEKMLISYDKRIERLGVKREEP